MMLALKDKTIDTNTVKSLHILLSQNFLTLKGVQYIKKIAGV